MAQTKMSRVGLVEILRALLCRAGTPMEALSDMTYNTLRQFMPTAAVTFDLEETARLAGAATGKGGWSLQAEGPSVNVAVLRRQAV